MVGLWGGGGLLDFKLMKYAFVNNTKLQCLQSRMTKLHMHIFFIPSTLGTITRSLTSCIGDLITIFLFPNIDIILVCLLPAAYFPSFMAVYVTIHHQQY